MRISTLAGGLAVAALVLSVGQPAAAHVGPGRPTAAIVYSTEPDDAAPTISIVRPDGSHDAEIPMPVDGAIVPRISPDGRHVVALTFTTDVRPGISRVDGSHFRRLTVPGIPASADISPCIWATTRLLLCEVRSQAGLVDGIYRVDARDRRRAVRLTVTPYPPGDDFGGGDIPGDVSPDGKQFVFMRSIPFPPRDNPDASQSGALFVADVGGGSVRRITRYGLPNSHDTGLESWGSGGRGIIFGTESGDLATIRPDGRHLRRLHLDIPAESYAFGPTWAPHGRRIAFGLYPAPDYQPDIYIGDLRSGHLRQLTDTPALDDAPDWGYVRTG